MVFRFSSAGLILMARDKCPKLKYCHCAKKICKKNQSPVRNGNLLHSFVLYGHLIAYADSRVSHINCAPDCVCSSIFRNNWFNCFVFKTWGASSKNNYQKISIFKVSHSLCYCSGAHELQGKSYMLQKIEIIYWAK